MMLPLMLGSVLVGALLAAAAAAADRQLAGNGRQRRFAWMAALLGVGGWTLLAPFRAGRTDADIGSEMADIANLPGSASSIAPFADATWAGLAAAADAILSIDLFGWVFAPAAGAPRWLNLLLAGVWAVSAAAMLLALFWSRMRFTRALPCWPVATIDGVPAHISPETGPGAWGVLRPRIILPRWVLDAPAEERAILLRHEREHQRAYDPALLALGAALVASMPWNPAIWWAYSRLRLTTEVDCDARVLRRGQSRIRYCEVLIDIAARGSAGPPLGLVTVSSNLEHRIVTMQLPRRKPSAINASFSAALVTLSLLAACSAGLPSSAEVEVTDVASAREALEQLETADQGEIVYLVDGEVVTAEEAMAIDREQIDRIDVTRSAANVDEPVTVQVTTKAAASRAGRVEAAVAEITRLTPPEETYYVIDGEPATAETVYALDHSQIHSVEVMKGRAAATRAGELGADYIPGMAIIELVTKAAAESPGAGG